MPNPEDPSFAITEVTEVVVGGNGRETDVIRGVASDMETANWVHEFEEDNATSQGRTAEVEIVALDGSGSTRRTRGRSFSLSGRGGRWPSEMNAAGHWGNPPEHPENN
jgi:hypothetical protein